MWWQEQSEKIVRLQTVTRKNLNQEKSWKEFISSSGREFAQKTALKRCRFFDQKSSGAAAFRW